MLTAAAQLPNSVAVALRGRVSTCGVEVGPFRPLVVTSASLVVTGALLVVTMFASNYNSN